MSARSILYVQQSTGGGSATGLVDMVAGRGPLAVRARRAVLRRNPFCERYRDAGARVRVLDARRPRSWAAAGPVRGAAHRCAHQRPQRRQPGAAPGPAHGAAHRQGDPGGGPDLVHHNDNPRGDRASILAGRMAGRLPQVATFGSCRRTSGPWTEAAGFVADRFVFVSEAVRRQFVEPSGGGATGRVVYDPSTSARFGNGRPGRPNASGRSSAFRRNGAGLRASAGWSRGRARRCSSGPSPRWHAAMVSCTRSWSEKRRRDPRAGRTWNRCTIWRESWEWNRG